MVSSQFENTLILDTSSFWYLPTNLRHLSSPNRKINLYYLIYFDFIDFYRLLHPAVYLLAIRIECCELIVVFLKLRPCSGQEKVDFCRSQERGMAGTWRSSLPTSPHFQGEGEGSLIWEGVPSS